MTTRKVAQIFSQLCTDANVTKFLQVLDDQLQSAGTKFDICDTVTMEDMNLAEMLLNAIVG